MPGDYPASAGVTWCGPPKSYTTGRSTPIRLAVIHTTEGNASTTAAENGCAYDKIRTDGTSCHVFHDSNSSLQEVLRTNTAHSAFFHGNTLGIQHELCGFASWSAVTWNGGYQQAMLQRAARAVADDCVRYGLEPRWLSVAEVRRAYYGPAPYPTGICGHIDVTRAFPEDPGSHTDPGSGFPRAQFVQLVQGFINGTGDDMTPAQDQLLKDIATVVDAMVNMRPNFVGAFGGQPVIFTQFMNGLKSDVNGIDITLSPEQIDSIATAVADKIVIGDIEHDAIVEAVKDGLAGSVITLTGELNPADE